MEHFQVLCLQKMDKFQEDNSDEIRQTIIIPSFLSFQTLPGWGFARGRKCESSSDMKPIVNGNSTKEKRPK